MITMNALLMTPELSTEVSITLSGLRVVSSGWFDDMGESRTLQRGDVIWLHKIGDMAGGMWLLHNTPTGMLGIYAIPSSLIVHPDAKAILDVLVDDVRENEYTVKQMMNITRSWLEL